MPEHAQGDAAENGRGGGAGAARAEDDQVRVLRVGQSDNRLDGLAGEPLQLVGDARCVRGVGGVLGAVCVAQLHVQR